MAKGNHKKVKTTTVKKTTTTTSNNYQSSQQPDSTYSYTYVEDYWEKSPKTDYTYAKSATYRAAYSDQGYISPNMSRRRLHGPSQKVVSPVAALSPTFKDSFTGPTYRAYSENHQRSYASSNKRSSLAANVSRSSIVTRSQSRASTPSSDVSHHSKGSRSIVNHLSFTDSFTRQQNVYDGVENNDYREEMISEHGEDVTDYGHYDSYVLPGTSGYQEEIHETTYRDTCTQAEMDKQLEYSGQPVSRKEKQISHLYGLDETDAEASDTDQSYRGTAAMTSTQSSESHTSVMSRVAGFFTSIFKRIVTVVMTVVAVMWLITKSSFTVVSKSVSKVKEMKYATGEGLHRMLWTTSSKVYMLFTQAVLMDAAFHRRTNLTRKRSRFCWLPLLFLLPLFLIGGCLLFTRGNVSNIQLPITPLHTFFFGSTVTKDSEKIMTTDHELHEKLQQIMITLQQQQGHQAQARHSLIVQQADLDKLRAELTILAAQAKTGQSQVHAQQAGLFAEHSDQIAAIQIQLAGITDKWQTTVQELNAAKLNLSVKQEQIDALQKQVLLLQDSYSTVLHKVQDCCKNNSALGLLIQSKVADALSQMMMGGAGGVSGSSEKSFPDWLHERFMSRDDVDSRLAAMAAQILAQIKAESSVNNASGTVFVGSGGSMLTEEGVRQMIIKELYVFGADKTGKVDFALESAGGSIISTRCSQTYRRQSAQISLFGIPLWYESNSPRTVIQPGVNTGQCWAFKGSQGYLVIQLSGFVKITSFSLEHIPKSLSPSGNIDSATKDFTVWGLKTENDREGKLLGNYTYDADGPPLQYFPVKTPLEESYNIIEMRIHSNHGNPEYTCIYRFRVHGVMMKM